MFKKVKLTFPSLRYKALEKAKYPIEKKKAHPECQIPLKKIYMFILYLLFILYHFILSILIDSEFNENDNKTF